MSGCVSPYQNFITVPNEAYYMKAQKQSAKPVEQLPATNYIKKEENKKKKNNFLLSPLGIATTVGLCLGLIALRGKGQYGKSFRNKVSDFIERMDDKLAAEKSAKGNNFGAKVCMFFVKAGKNIGQWTKKICNLVPCRDIRCEQAMNWLDKGFAKIGLKKFKPFTWMCDITRTFFQNCTVKAHKAVYRGNFSKLGDGMSEFSKYIDDAIKVADEPQKTKLIQMKERLFTGKNSWFSQFESTFGHATFQQRLTDYQKGIENLPERAKAFIGVSDGKMFKFDGYITDELTGAQRADIRQELMAFRRAFSFNKVDVRNSIQSSSSSIRELLDADDVGTRTMLRKLNSHLEEYLKSKVDKDKANKFLHEVEKLSDHLKSKYKDAPLELMKKQLQAMRATINNGDSMGEMQKILLTLRDTLPEKEFLKAKAIVNDMNKCVDKNITSEMSVYQKFGEMKLGSAFTDVGSLALTAGAGAYFIAKPGTKEEHIEASLRQGFPIFSALATMVYCTARMMSVVPSLIISTSVGFAFKKAGDVTAENYVKGVEKRKLTQAAVAAYKPQKNVEAVV